MKAIVSVFDILSPVGGTTPPIATVIPLSARLVETGENPVPSPLPVGLLAGRSTAQQGPSQAGSPGAPTVVVLLSRVLPAAALLEGGGRAGRAPLLTASQGSEGFAALRAPPPQ